MNVDEAQHYEPKLSKASSVSLDPLELTRLRLVLYQFFGRLFLYPDAGRFTHLQAIATELCKDTDLWALFPFGEALQGLLDKLVSITPAEYLSIEEEYVRLFIAKPAAVPLESVYIDKDGLARGLIQSHLVGEYLKAGLDLAPGMGIPPDHIAVECEFLAFLCEKELKAWETEAVELAKMVNAQQADFLRKHLKRWFPAFSRRLLEAHPDRLYGDTVEAAFAFLRHELQLFV